MRLHVHHTTAYRYTERLALSTQYLRLSPRESARQRVLGWRLELPGRAARSVDPFGNTLHVVTVDTPHSELLITVDGEVDISRGALSPADSIHPMVFLRPGTLAVADEAMQAFALEQDPALPPPEGARLLMERLRSRMRFLSGTTDACTTAAAAFAAGSGVCQDFTHVFTGCARALGIPARYVSGYLFTDREEHVASHAWAEVGTGDAWWGLDVTNGCEIDQRHLQLAVGMDYLDASPVRGVRRGGGEEWLEARALVRSAGQ
ncbi:MAG: transglutaminase N-terminal domain-containing protein [Gammaproteobacteria bacterium]